MKFAHTMKAALIVELPLYNIVTTLVKNVLRVSVIEKEPRHWRIGHPQRTSYRGMGRRF
jgi:hypothetical protein